VDDADAPHAAAAAAQARLCGIVPPLAERARGAATYADFARATTAAYFGKRGLQRGGAVRR
jgi:hypothetical protein